MLLLLSWTMNAETLATLDSSHSELKAHEVRLGPCGFGLETLIQSQWS